MIIFKLILLGILFAFFVGLLGCAPMTSDPQAQAQYQANRAAWWNSYALQNSIDMQSNQQAMDAFIYRPNPYPR